MSGQDVSKEIDKKYAGMNANKKCGSYPLLTYPNIGLESSNFRLDCPPSLELNPLAAGDQTPFEKGETAYVLMI